MAEGVEYEMTKAKQTAAGMDGWQMGELALLTKKGYGYIAKI